MREILKAYMLHVYKWHGSFECDAGEDPVTYHPEFEALKKEILEELEAKRPRENIISTVIKVPGSLDEDLWHAMHPGFQRIGYNFNI